MSRFVVVLLLLLVLCGVILGEVSWSEAGAPSNYSRNFLRSGPPSASPLATILSWAGTHGVSLYNGGSSAWYGDNLPRQALFDYGPFEDAPFQWYSPQQLSGTTWHTDGSLGSTGIMVVDLGRLRRITSFSVFQAVDGIGAVSHIEIRSFPDDSPLFPAWNDPDWTVTVPSTVVLGGAKSVNSTYPYIGDPTVLAVAEDGVQTRYLRIDVQNDQRYGVSDYITLKGIKAFGSEVHGECSFNTSEPCTCNADEEKGYWTGYFCDECVKDHYPAPDWRMNGSCRYDLYSPLCPKDDATVPQVSFSLHSDGTLSATVTGSHSNVVWADLAQTFPTQPFACQPLSFQVKRSSPDDCSPTVEIIWDFADLVNHCPHVSRMDTMERIRYFFPFFAMMNLLTGTHASQNYFEQGYVYSPVLISFPKSVTVTSKEVVIHSGFNGTAFTLGPITYDLNAQITALTIISFITFSWDFEAAISVVSTPPGVNLWDVSMTRIFHLCPDGNSGDCQAIHRIEISGEYCNIAGDYTFSYFVKCRQGYAGCPPEDPVLVTITLIQNENCEVTERLQDVNATMVLQKGTNPHGPPVTEYTVGDTARVSVELKSVIPITSSNVYQVGLCKEVGGSLNCSNLIMSKSTTPYGLQVATMVQHINPSSYAFLFVVDAAALALALPEQTLVVLVTISDLAFVTPSSLPDSVKTTTSLLLYKMGLTLTPSVSSSSSEFLSPPVVASSPHLLKSYVEGEKRVNIRGIAPPSSPPPEESSSKTSPPPPEHSSNHGKEPSTGTTFTSGALAGVAVGGVVLGAFAVIFYVLQKKRRTGGALRLPPNDNDDEKEMIDVDDK